MHVYGMPVMKFLKSVKIIKGRRAALRLHKREIRIQRLVHRADSERIVDQATITIYTIPITQLYGQIILYYGRLCSPKLDAEHSSLEKTMRFTFLDLINTGWLCDDICHHSGPYDIVRVN